MQVRTKLFVVLACLVALPLFAQNLIQGSNMEDESKWQVIYYNTAFQPEYEFNYTGDSVDVASKRGGNLHVWCDDATDGGQLLLYQRVTCIAGQEYKASALIKLCDYYSDGTTLGQWFQYYVAVEEPDPNAGDFNPAGTKMYNIDSWLGDLPVLWEDFNGYFEAVHQESHYATAPYWVCPGDPGTEVDVTVGVKFGSSPVPGASFDLIVDDVCFYPVTANVVETSTMVEDGAWQVQYYNAEFQPGYEFGYTLENAPKYIRGEALHVMLDESATGQLLFYQRIPLIAGETYRASGAIYIMDFFSPYNPESQGPWYQFYATTEEPDALASDFNPGGAKMFDISAWDTGCSMAEFEAFQGYWEQVRCLSEISGSPYYTVPGTPGETVNVTVGIKFGIWGPEAATFELLVDDVQFLLADEGEGGVGVDFETDPLTPNEFALEQNYPNPFNPMTTISFTLPVAANTTLQVYNTLGVNVATLVSGQMAAGRHTVTLDMANLPSGIYYYTLRQNDYAATKKCVVLK